MRYPNELPANMKTGRKTAFPRFIRPSKTDSLLWVESGAAIMEGITESEVHVVEPRMRASVVVEVNWAR